MHKNHIGPWLVMKTLQGCGCCWNCYL